MAAIWLQSKEVNRGDPLGSVWQQVASKTYCQCGTTVAKTGDTDCAGPKPADEVELLLENARLRDALEPFLDESLEALAKRAWTTPEENEFLESMLAWERAPVLPIRQWFQPELVLPHPAELTEEQVSVLLPEVLRRLYEKRIVLEYTEHLSDRQLYVLLYRDILPAQEKYLQNRRGWLCWRCIDEESDAETWLTYYASDAERRQWAAQTGLRPPARRSPPYPRQLPQAK